VASPTSQVSCPVLTNMYRLAFLTGMHAGLDAQD
jgi:hypothetical protein